MPWVQSVTSLTLALMEDTGWYKANYSASAGVLIPSAFGYGAGCAFLADDCIVDGGAVPPFGVGTFCNVTTDTSDVRCDVTHTRAARCDLVDHGTYGLDPLYPYLDVPEPPGTNYRTRFGNVDADGDSLLGSFLRFDAEYCPTYAAPTSFVYDGNGVPTGPLYVDCSLGETAPGDAYAFESFGGDGSRCFDTLGGGIGRPLCLNIECAEYGGVVAVAVTVGVNGETVICETDGQVVDLPGLTDVRIECPRREILCPGYDRSIVQHVIFGGCLLFCISYTKYILSHDCRLSSQHDPVFIARLIVPVAEFVVTGS
jgi:hypothetical protein